MILRRMITTALAAVFLAAWGTGCRSTICYQEQAVERAREFLLREARDLTPEQQAFVRFNDPVLLAENLLGSNNTGLATAAARSQICVTWMIPEKTDVYMVFGISTGRMSDWYPNRLIRKTFTAPDRTRVSAVAAARAFVQDNLYFDLSAKELNAVRFEEPRIVRSSFTLPGDAKGLQFSLIWKAAAEEERIVISGCAAAEHLQGFQVISGGRISVKELQKNCPDQEL